MPTATPLPIQAAVPTVTGKALGISSGDSLSADSKGVFGGLLSGELDAGIDVAKLTDGLDDFVIVAENLNAGLPASGNSLPQDVNVQLEADIAVLEVDPELAVENLSLAAGFQSQLPVTAQADGFGVSLQTSHVAGESLRPTDAVRSLLLNGQDLAQAKLASPLNALTDVNTGIDKEVLPFSQVRQNTQLQNLFSPLVRQADAAVGAGQISRVLEQFSEFNQRAVPVTGATLSAPIGGIAPLSESGLASSSSGVAQLSVDVPVQDERWQKAFSQRVVWSVGNNQSARLRIHPAELGQIDIQVKVENDKASVVFNTQHGMVKEAIELALPRLREMLAEQGLDLENVDVNSGDINQQQAGTDQGSEEHDNFNAGASGSLSEDTSATELVSNIIIDDDAIDYYV
ncbi:MAG: flagellar hook-length control protein FliK [Sulfuriflexus sp.]|nr:flagellar hook-length control protein FliK [Sulfuriflexus sp.]